MADRAAASLRPAGQAAPGRWRQACWRDWLSLALGLLLCWMPSLGMSANDRAFNVAMGTCPDWARAVDLLATVVDRVVAANVVAYHAAAATAWSASATGLPGRGT